MVKSTASAVWEGGLKDGKGRVTGHTGVFTDTPYTYERRFENKGHGTTPEELIAASHASCYAMAFSSDLQKAGHTPTHVAVKCTITLEPIDGKPTAHTSALEVEAIVPGIDEAKFMATAELTRDNCPISRLLKAKITLAAKLVHQPVR